MRSAVFIQEGEVEWYLLIEALINPDLIENRRLYIGRRAKISLGRSLGKRAHAGTHTQQHACKQVPNFESVLHYRLTPLLTPVLSLC